MSAGSYVDVDAVGSGVENRSQSLATVGPINRHRFSYRDSAKATRIEDVDFTAGRGLGNRTGKGLARSRTAAWICVVTDARDPGPRGLRLHGRRTREHECRQSEERRII